MPSCMKESSDRRGKKVASRYTSRRLVKSLALRVLNGYIVQSALVKAFMKVASERRVMLKNGSRTGKRFDPASTTCSRMCATPVESFGTVGKKTAKELLSSAH